MGMKANSGYFIGTCAIKDCIKCGHAGKRKEYNSAGSKDVGVVLSQIISSKRKLEMVGIPNSVHIKKDNNGTVLTERYYGANGRAYLDIDYSNHGNPKMHPVVPHQHRITFSDGRPQRSKKGEAIKK